MKKISILATVLTSLVFVGCSLNGGGNQNNIKTFTLSPSLWKSQDAGKTWEVKNKGEGAVNATAIEVLSFAINPRDGQNVYAGLKKGGILETTDGGKVWRYINYQSEKVYGLALSPDGRTLYASGVWQGKGKMFKTDDRGKNWQEIYTSPSEGPLIVSLTIDQQNPKILYATTSEREALKSTDGGESWKNIYLANDPILKIAIDAQNSQMIYFITTAASVFRSFDGGTTFESLNDKIDNSLKSYSGNQFEILRTDPTIGEKIYLAGSGGIAMSQDAGENWKKITSLNDPQAFPIKSLAISRDPQKIVYGSLEAAYQSTDSGETWTTFQFDNKLATKVMEFDPSNTNVLYLGFSK